MNNNYLIFEDFDLIYNVKPILAKFLLPLMEINNGHKYENHLYNEKCYYELILYQN